MSRFILYLCSNVLFFFSPNERKKNHSRDRSPYLQCKVRRCVDCGKKEKLQKRGEENIFVGKTWRFLIRIRWNAIPRWHEPRSRGLAESWLSIVEFAVSLRQGATSSHQLTQFLFHASNDVASARNTGNGSNLSMLKF